MVNMLVTGGCGFIGSNFVNMMLSQRQSDIERLIVIDKMTYAADKNRLPSSPVLEVIEGDIASESDVNRLFSDHEVNVIVNFAAESHVDRSISAPLTFLENNVRGTVNLLEACRKRKVDQFVQVSTDEVYGSLVTVRDLPWNERCPTEPNSPYSASKAAADGFVRSYGRTYGLNTVITRCCNNYGKFQHEEKFIPTVIRKALRDEPIPIYGSGMQRREWIHVDDHCEAIASVAFADFLPPGEVFNVGSGNEMANIEMAKLILDILGKPQKLITSVDDRPGHDVRYALDYQKIQMWLKWYPKRNVDSDLEDVVNWYVSNLKL